MLQLAIQLAIELDRIVGGPAVSEDPLDRPDAGVGVGVPNQGHAYRDRPRAGRTVLDHLSARYPRVDRSVWAARLARSEVSLDGAPASGAEVLRNGSELVWHRPPWVEPFAPLRFAIVYRDEFMLAVAKPRGLPVLPGGGLYQEHTLLHQLARRLPAELLGAAPIHRLGTGTSGVVLCAWDPAVRRRLSDAFRTGDVVREYSALVVGDLAQECRVIDRPIGPVPHRELSTIHAASDQGKAARSLIHVAARREDETLVRIRIETGRSHQIRAHLAVIGHPLRGDPLFAAGGGFVDGGLAVPTDSGYWLHAGRLVVKHPMSGTPVTIEVPPPPPLRHPPDDVPWWDLPA